MCFFNTQKKIANNIKILQSKPTWPKIGFCSWTLSELSFNSHKNTRREKTFQISSSTTNLYTQEIATKCDDIKIVLKKLTQTRGSKTKIDPFFSHKNHHHQLSKAPLIFSPWTYFIITQLCLHKSYRNGITPPRWWKKHEQTTKSTKKSRRERQNITQFIMKTSRSP